MSRYRWPKPEGIPTAMTLPELELLQDYAHKAGTVLEIGALYGFSAIGMALAGAKVTSVDPHYDGPADNPDTWPRFIANVRAHNVGVIARRMSAARFDALEPETNRYGLVFIDGDHTWPQPYEDALMALRRLIRPCPAWPDCADDEGPCFACAEYARLEGGYIAMHDIHPLWPGVVRAATQLTVEGRMVEVAAAGCLRVYHCKASSVSGMSSSPTEAL